MPDRQRAVVFDLFHDTFHEGGLSFTVFPYESDLVAPFDGQVGVAEHHMVAIRLCHVLHDHRIVAGAGRGREFQAKCRSVFLVHLQYLKLFKHLDAALHLQGLGVCTFETFDKFPCFGNHLLLLVEGFLLLYAAFLAELQVTAVIHLVVVDAAHRDLDRTGGDMVDKRAVVADHNHRLSVVDQEVFEPLDRFDVQMVGRLVQQQHVGFLQQQLCQLDTHAPSAAELAGLPPEVVALESQSEQCFLDVGVIVDLFDRIKLLAECRDTLDQLHITVRFVVGPCL